VAYYLLFLFGSQSASSLDYEVPWTDCPDYFIRVGNGNNYRCVNIAPESVPGAGYNRVPEIGGLSDTMTRREKCSVASTYQGLSWEWCDDPRNQ
jgi:hypothetical protein